MTFQPKGADGAPAEGKDQEPEVTNKKERAVLIRKANAALNKIAKEVEALQAEAREVKGTIIKGKLGMKMVDFNFAARLLSLEDEALAQMVDTIREVGEAGGKTKQLELIFGK